MHFLNLATAALVATASALPNKKTEQPSLVSVRYDPDGSWSVTGNVFIPRNKAGGFIDQDESLRGDASLPTFEYDLNGELKKLGYGRIQSLTAQGDVIDEATVSQAVFDRLEKMKARQKAMASGGAATSVNEQRGDGLFARAAMRECLNYPCDDNPDCKVLNCGSCDDDFQRCDGV